MTWDGWIGIVDKLNASYPDEPINAATAREWYVELGHLDEGDVWLAVRQLRIEQKWRPELAEILVACKIRRVEMAEQARHQQLQRGGRGVPMPPETKQAWAILLETLRPGVTVEERRQARQMIDALASQLAERMYATTGEVA